MFTVGHSRIGRQTSSAVTAFMRKFLTQRPLPDNLAVGAVNSVNHEFMGLRGRHVIVYTGAGSILVRVVMRLNPKVTNEKGSQTNELMRHMLFALLLAGQFDFSPQFVLIAVFLIHSVTMLLPYPMPHPIIDRAKTAVPLGLVNVALLAAWLLPIATPAVTTAFVAAYLYSFIVGWIGWRRTLVVKSLP